jgi:hypothetical protein
MTVVPDAHLQNGIACGGSDTYWIRPWLAMIAMTQAEHKDCVLVSRSEAREQFNAIECPDAYSRCNDSNEKDTVTDFARRCIRYANKFEGQPGMSVSLKKSHAGVVDGMK